MNNLKLNPHEYNSRKIVKTLNLIEIKNLAEIIIEGKIGESKIIFDLGEIHEQYDQYEFIIEQCKNLNDKKLMLWVPLPIEDKLKMFINQTDTHESQLMQMLIYVQYQFQSKLIKERDQYLITTLDNAVYEKYTQL